MNNVATLIKLIVLDAVTLFFKLCGNHLKNFADGIKNGVMKAAPDTGIKLVDTALSKPLEIISTAITAPIRLLASGALLIGKLFFPLLIVTIVFALFLLIRSLVKRAKKKKLNRKIEDMEKQVEEVKERDSSEKKSSSSMHVFDDNPSD